MRGRTLLASEEWDNLLELRLEMYFYDLFFRLIITSGSPCCSIAYNGWCVALCAGFLQTPASYFSGWVRRRSTAPCCSNACFTSHFIMFDALWREWRMSLTLLIFINPPDFSGRCSGSRVWSVIVSPIAANFIG